jgi:hypothetical protein
MARAAFPESSRRRLDETAQQLRALAPNDWVVSVGRRTGTTGFITIADDQGNSGRLDVTASERIEPRDLDSWELPEGSLVAAAWLSPRTREILRSRCVNYVDRTGNVELRVRQPALYIRTDGANRDPNPRPLKQPNLRGPRVWALMRTLIEVAPPYTAGALSGALSLDDGYVSRVLQVLSNERLITRTPSGPVTSVEWEPLLRQLAITYSLFEANEASTWVASSGAEQLLLDLADKKPGAWAVTGSFAASSIAPVAAPEMAVIYTADPERLAKVGRLLPTKTGANVILLKPYDPIVFRRTITNGPYPCTSVVQVAVDSLTGNARMPAEGEAVVGWMRRKATRWQASTLQG